MNRLFAGNGSWRSTFNSVRAYHGFAKAVTINPAEAFRDWVLHVDGSRKGRCIVTFKKFRCERGGASLASPDCVLATSARGRRVAPQPRRGRPRSVHLPHQRVLRGDVDSRITLDPAGSSRGFDHRSPQGRVSLSRNPRHGGVGAFIARDVLHAGATVYVTPLRSRCR